MNAPASDAIEHFVAKWHRREPEMALAEVFCPPERRAVFRAWGALVQELREAAYELSDARVTGVKCQWWAEELVNLSQGRGRHPISAVLVLPGLPWPALARALLEQTQTESRPADAGQALEQVRPFAQALADVEAGLFGATPVAADALGVHLLLQRLPAGLAAGDQARLPLNLLARHGLTTAQVGAGQGQALLADWAKDLMAALSVAPGSVCLFRRQRQRFDQARLLRLARGRGFDPPSPAASLWRAWRTARGH